jgi:hypothetical protein
VHEGVKYIYDVNTQSFREEKSQRQAPRAVQDLLQNGDVAIAIAKGLVILGY